MEIATGSSTLQDSAAAADVAWQQLAEQLKHDPVLVICSASAAYSARALYDRLTELAPAGCKITGVSSCLGSMDNSGFHSADGYGLNLTAFADDTGDFGVGLVDQNDAPEVAAAQAMHNAIDDADRAGELPIMVWLSAAPGREEAVLKGISSVIGEHVPVIGGSSADNEIAGNWWQFGAGRVQTDGVLLIAMYPQCEVGISFHSGYAPTDHSGTVTGADGRIVYSIDDRPAAQVYNDWTDGLIEDQLSGGNILQASTFHPFGKEAGQIEHVPYYALLHPEQVLDDGAIRLFSSIPSGEKITLMSGSADSLSTRAGAVARGILERHNWNPDQIAGSLVVYCAGCMLGIRDRMDDVTDGLNDALGRTPFHGMFTFGEQGCFIDGINRHGNLMISVVVFTKD